MRLNESNLIKRRAMSPSTVYSQQWVGDVSVSVVWYAPNQVLQPHGHDQDGLTVVLHGHFVEEAKHGSVVAQPGWTGARPLGLTHANRFGPGGAVVLAIIPERPRIDAMPERWGWNESPVAWRAGLRLLANREDALTELVAELEPDERGARDHRWLRQVKERLEDPAARPTVAALAREHGVHPVYLTRRFRRWTGVSIREYRTMLMVRRASQQLVLTKRAVSSIAHECGFADHSHMCRAFRTVAGWSPSQIRKERIRIDSVGA